MRRTNYPFTRRFLALAIILFSLSAQAQKGTTYGVFDHLGAGVSVGTDGIGIDAATTLTAYAALRAGVSFWPAIKYDRNIKLNSNDPVLTDDVDIQAKSNIFDVKLLADFYPIKKSSFHITVGAFIGNGDIATVTNTSMFIKDPKKYGKLGLKMGDYRLTSDKNGYAYADVKVNSFKPYVGIGFGRAVPKKSRVSVSFDLGVKFWGKPGLGADTKDDWGNEFYHKFTYSDLNEDDYEDVRDAFEIAEKVIVFPVLNIRINGRIF